MKARNWLFACITTLALVACGSNSGTATDAAGGGSGSGSGEGSGSGSGSGNGSGSGSQGCTVSGTTQCGDCIDNDMDGKIDGFDPECAGPLDNREDSFATGIPGDNSDATMQDCFFDGNSGQGGGDCNQHVCCLLQAADKAECEALNPDSNSMQYNRADCYKPFGSADVPAGCTANCGPLAPPGCDCFGCCTVCSGTGCRDILLNTAVSPTCDQTNITDPGPDGVDNTGDEPCRRCVKNTMCGSPECDGGDASSCILCPGQDPSTLPSSCSGDSTCPSGIMECAADGSCPTDLYCSSGCCVGIIQ